MQTMLVREEAKAEECLFTDDRTESVEGAWEGGIQTYSLYVSGRPTCGATQLQHFQFQTKTEQEPQNCPK